MGIVSPWFPITGYATATKDVRHAVMDTGIVLPRLLSSKSTLMRNDFVMSLFCFCLRLLLPFGKFPLSFLALVKGENVGHDTAGDSLDLVLRNIGVILISFFLLLKCCLHIQWPAAG